MSQLERDFSCPLSVDGTQTRHRGHACSERHLRRPIMNTGAAGSASRLGIRPDQHRESMQTKRFRHFNPFGMHMLLSPLAVGIRCRGDHVRGTSQRASHTLVVQLAEPPSPAGAPCRNCTVETRQSYWSIVFFASRHRCAHHPIAMATAIFTCI